MIRWNLYVAGTILLLIGLSKCNFLSCPDPCVNGVISCTNETGTYLLECSACEARTRLTNKSGVIVSHKWEEGVNPGYANKTPCSVLIESPVGTTIRLYISDFRTECAWDFLHFHDGVSPFDPTIGVYGGLLVDEGISLLKQSRELMSSSNKMLLVFRPDRFVNHDGFSIVYRVDGCPHDCAGHGTCNGGVCTCEDHWHGDNCQNEKCSCQNGGSCLGGICVCLKGFSGENCEIDMSKNWWQYVKSTGSSPGGRANFGGALVGHDYWVFGGYHQDRVQDFVKMAKYDILTNQWTIATESGPSNRDGHTLTAYQNNLFMFGGQVNYEVTNDLWKYDISTSQWHQLNPQNTRTSSMGHCAVLINSTIYFLGGLDGHEVVILDVQTYDIVNNVWTVIDHRTMTRAFYDAQSANYRFTDGRIYHGRYGPSCVHNPITDRIIVYGGLNTTRITGENSNYWLQSEAETVKESTFAEYDTYLNHWSNLYKTDINSVPMVYLSAVSVVGKSLVVLGGRQFTIGPDTCYNTNPYVLDMETGEGKVLTSFEKLEEVGPFRMGHSSFTYNNSVYFFGGWSGNLNDDYIVYHISECELKATKTACETEQREDFNTCTWDNDKCITSPLSECGRLKCYGDCMPGDGLDRRCHVCQTTPGCTWDQFYPDTCRQTSLVNTADFDEFYKCRNVPKTRKIQCSEYKLCDHCKGECYWDTVDDRCAVNVKMAKSETNCEHVNRPCTDFLGCGTCVGTGTNGNHVCMWCALDKLYDDGRRSGKCVDLSTYGARYPYGQCVTWATRQDPLCPAADGCSGHGNCTLCQSQPECGWCNDNTGTGTGTCHVGSYHAPFDEQACPVKSWFYELCPSCQCNGHSNCTDHMTCDQCQGNTLGDHCDSCVDGYHGDAANNGICEPCDCGDHSKPFCDKSSGRCSCDSWGVGGLRCDTCLSDFRGDPKSPDGKCYKLLRVGVPDSIPVHNHKLNLLLDINSKTSHDLLVAVKTPNVQMFIITASVVYKDESTYSKETYGPDISSWSQTYKRSSIDWDKKEAELRLWLEFPSLLPDTTVYLYVEVRKPSSQIDLKQFFIIFFSCIVILLLVFLLAWTAKIRYSQYRYQRSQEIQLMERALRPYQCHRVLFKDTLTPTTGRIFEVRPVGIEPLTEEKFAIVTHLMAIPGPKDINLVMVSGSFVSSLSYSKAISNPTINF